MRQPQWKREPRHEDSSDGLPGLAAGHHPGCDQLQPRAQDRHREARPPRQLLRLQRGAASGGGEAEQPQERGAGGGPQGQQLPARDNQVRGR